MAVRGFDIDGRSVGNGAPCYVIAEAGSNHDNDFDKALRLVDTAAEAGADAVKFQAFRAESHYSRHTPGFTYLDGRNTYDLIKSLELDRSWQEKLKTHAEERGICFFSSPCDVDAVTELRGLGVGAYKLASFDLPDTDLIGLMADTGKPVILSTGMADWQDIQRGIDACRARGNSQVALLQCTSLYPAPAHLSNLKAMDVMRRVFDTVVGYSDHTLGEHMALAAVALGAEMIEKHFTLSNDGDGPDHRFAMEPSPFRDMVARLRDVEVGLGDGAKAGPREEESEMFEKGRRSLHARVAIFAGTTITADMLTVKRPGLGISPGLRDVVVGRVARRDIDEDHWITWDMV